VTSYYRRKELEIDIATAATTTKMHPWPVLLFLLTRAIALGLAWWLAASE